MISNIKVKGEKIYKIDKNNRELSDKTDEVSFWGNIQIVENDE